MLHISFTKMSGAGNDFVVIDNRDFKLKADVPSFVRVVTRRRVAIGADGLVLLEPSDNAEFRNEVLQR